MHEKTILTLLSQTVGQVIDQTVNQNWSIEEKNELSTHLADAAWNALIFMMRNCLANNQPVIIEELGRFERTDKGWTFHPAASLLEGATLKMTALEGHPFLAHQALFYLKESLAVMDRIPEDVKLPAEEQALTIGRMAEFPFQPMGKQEEPLLSARLEFASEKLGNQLTRLSGRRYFSIPIVEALDIKSIKSMLKQAETEQP
jgi:hypothetical protein